MCIFIFIWYRFCSKKTADVGGNTLNAIFLEEDEDATSDNVVFFVPDVVSGDN